MDNILSLEEHFESLSVFNIHYGKATVVCVGFEEWQLPGGKRVTSRSNALAAAKRIHHLMLGE